MTPELRFHLPCSCGAEIFIAISQAGTTVSCIKCSEELRVPGLRELKQLGGIDISPLGQLKHSIKWQDKPFDGSCQSCKAYVGTMILAVNLAVASSEQEVCRAIAIPCVFCEMCANQFRKGLWVGLLQSLGNAILGAVWLLIALVFASVLALALPFIGISFVLAVMSCMLYHLTRRRANPFLLRHLDRVCKLKEALTDVDEYVVTFERMRRFDVKEWRR